MIGNGEAAMRADAGWFPHLTRYLAIDGGAGAHLLAALEKYDPRLQEVASPRHANLLLVIEPMSQKLAPVVREVAHALPRPAHVLIVALSDALLTSAADEGVVEALIGPRLHAMILA